MAPCLPVMRRRAAVVAVAALSATARVRAGGGFRGSQQSAPEPANATRSSPPAATAALPKTAAPVLSSEDKIRCGHGHWHGEVCDCLDGWHVAGITDTIFFAEGRCAQFQCESTSKCQDLLSIPEAQCPVKGWNCYCGLGWALHKHLHGFEVFENGGAECMGLMYALSVWGTEWMEFLAMTAWQGFLIAAVSLLGFGRKRSMCDHHLPSLWNSFKICLSLGESTCPGDCTAYRPDRWLENTKDDFAWSLYALELGVWSYLFGAIVYIIVLFMWSIVLWAMVILAAICMCIGSMCMACGAVGGNCGNCAGCGSCDCSGACSTPCCDGCCTFTGGASGGASDYNFFYGGNIPYDPFWGYSGYSRAGRAGCCCDACSDVHCLMPLGYLVYVFPAMPENVWGGFFGRYILGTHPATPDDCMYRGGNPYVDFFSFNWMRRHDLHGEGEWRERVRSFLGRTIVDDISSPHSSSPRHLPGDRAPLVANSNGDVSRVGRARVVSIGRSFNTDDGIPPSSFNDYQKNECWICMSRPTNGWDMWLSCKHVFCEDCSTTMLHRNMPCPLCRVASATVLRGTQREESGPHLLSNRRAPHAAQSSSKP